MVDKILNSGEVQYRNEFAWDVHIIQDDSVLNAFATPGGYIYVYSGLIKYLDKEDDLMGVLGHEIAHADLRHSIRTMQKVYGAQLLLQIVTGKSDSKITEIAKDLALGLGQLAFSREFESEADDQSVVYLSATAYECDACAAFFKKLESQGSGSKTPEFLSTHPSDQSRIDAITEKAQEIGCDTTPLAPASWTTFQNTYLP